MHPPALPADESTRIDTLRALHVLDTSPEERFDRLTRLAKRLFGVPIALVSLVDVDRQWFKSRVGLDVSETPRDISFCGHAILGDEIFTVPDTLFDERFHDNPLVTDTPNIRFYAGCPLRVANGSKVGTLCLLDVEPRTMSEEDRALLRDLARMAEQELAAVQMANMDALTLVSNRRGFEALAQHVLNLCRRMDKPATLLFFDLNDFKQVNDTYGHAEGDAALVAFSGLLRSAFRDSDVIGRLGGDEFVTLLSGVSREEGTAAIQRLGESVDAHNAGATRGYDLGYSVGEVAFDPDQHPTIAELLAEADTAMYAHKQQIKSGGDKA
jgi:diguanylate cyclase (GGDEF)-like protein